jgi:hypothetical protein
MGPDVRLGLGALVDLSGQGVDLAVEVSDQPEQYLQSPAGRLAELDVLEELRPALVSYSFD